MQLQLFKKRENTIPFSLYGSLYHPVSAASTASKLFFHDSRKLPAVFCGASHNKSIAIVIIARKDATVSRMRLCKLIYRISHYIGVHILFKYYHLLLILWNLSFRL